LQYSVINPKFKYNQLFITIVTYYNKPLQKYSISKLRVIVYICVHDVNIFNDNAVCHVEITAGCGHNKTIMQHYLERLWKNLKGFYCMPAVLAHMSTLIQHLPTVRAREFCMRWRLVGYSNEITVIEFGVNDGGRDGIL